MNENDYLALDFTDFRARVPIDRRDFLRQVGGGILILVTLAGETLAQAGRPGGDRRSRGPADFNAFLRIGADGRITCFTGKIEMGQGAITSLAQTLADELNAPLDSIDMVMGDTDLCPWDMGTFGSMTTRFFGPTLQRAAAEARTVLIDLAAKQFDTPADRLTAEDGFVVDRDDRGRRIAFGQLARGQRIEKIVDRKAVLEAVTDHDIVGQPTPRTDARAKVTGQARFTGDVVLPGMLYARIVRPPAHGAKLTKVDTTRAERMDGVRVVKDGDLVAVLHETPDGAQVALEQVEAAFDERLAEVDDRSIFDRILESAGAGDELAAGGDLDTGRKGAAKTVEATYLDGYVAHAPIETHTAVAQVEGEKATVWASTQTPFMAKSAVADTLGLPAENVRIITPFVGGGFGGKGQNPQVVEAAQLADLAGCPVHLAWTRAEEFFYDSFRPAAVVKISSGVTAAGEIAFWNYGVYEAGARGAEHFYAIPHHRTMVYGSGWRGGSRVHPFPVGAWRAPANNTNTFARESQIDLMARDLGADPLAFRLANMTDKRMRRVLEAAAERFRWQPGQGGNGHGSGIACGIDAGTYVAHMAEVEVDRSTGKVQVQRVVCAQDMGLVVNPRGATLQVEGCITMGLGYALTEEVRFSGGRIKDLDYSSYQIPRFSWVPQIDTVFVKSDVAAPQGGGEPAIICMGALVANAIHDAIGVRVYEQPMTRERILEAAKRG